MVPTLLPVLLVHSWPEGWKCLQLYERCRGSMGEMGGAVESPLKWEKGG